MSSAIIALEALSITSALMASGGMVTLSLFDIPELRTQPASRALPLIRWLFSRGSHIFPQAAGLSFTGFACLAYAAVPAAAGGQSLAQLASALLLTAGPASGYLAAAGLCIGIVPITRFAMIPTNFRLMELNEELGGARSEKSAALGEVGVGRSAEESTSGKGDVNEYTDLSKPLEKTRKEATAAQEEEVQRLLTKFEWLNLTRAFAIGAGGVVGLVVALAG